MSVREPNNRPGGSTWVPAVTIQGKLYHRLGPLSPADGETKQFAQLYVHDPADTEATTEFDARLAGFRFSKGTSEAERARVAHLLRLLQDAMHTEHAYVQDFIMAAELFESNDAGQPAELLISRDARPDETARTQYDTANDRPRTYQEVTCLVGEGEMERGCVQLRRRHVPTGAKWQRKASQPKGTLLTHDALEAALSAAAWDADRDKFELSADSLGTLDLRGLRADHYVAASDGCGFFEQPDRRGLESIDFNHRAFDPLHFVLLFPHGDDGWHWYMERAAAPPVPRRDAATAAMAVDPTPAATGFVEGDADDDVQSQASEWSAASQCVGEPCASHAEGDDDAAEFCDHCWDKWNATGANLHSRRQRSRRRPLSQRGATKAHRRGTSATSRPGAGAMLSPHRRCRAVRAQTRARCAQAVLTEDDSCRRGKCNAARAVRAPARVLRASTAGAPAPRRRRRGAAQRGGPCASRRRAHAMGASLPRILLHGAR